MGGRYHRQMVKRPKRITPLQVFFDLLDESLIFRALVGSIVAAVLVACLIAWIEFHGGIV